MGWDLAADRPPGSVQAETEGVPRRVEEHPEGRTGLVLMLSRAKAEHRRLGGVEVVDDHVEMHLLGHLLGRPARRGVGLDLLEGDALTVIRADLSPVGGDVDFPIQHRAVERRESARIRTVDDDAWEACDSHAGTVRGGGPHGPPGRALRPGPALFVCDSDAEHRHVVKGPADDGQPGGHPSRDRPDGTLSTGHRLAMLNGSVIAGNPVSMGEMTRHMPDAGSYAPVTFLIQELPDGGTRVAYDSVASEMAPYRDAAAAQVAERLDAEVLGLLRQVNRVPAPGTP
jgi:hypothetical protein